MSPKRIAIISGIIAALIITFLIILATGGGKPSANTAQGKLETSTVAAIQAQINLNYVTEGNYAYNYDNLIEEANDEDKSLLREYRDSLNEFDYSVRGDGNAYQIVYTNIAGEKITINGDYKNEYH